MRKLKLTERKAGFTLIEVLMAMAILVLGMTGVVALYAVAVDAHQRAQDNAGVAFLAESMLSDISADFVATDLDGDGTATFAESFVELCRKYKHLDEDENYVWQHGVDAPNSPGFRCEVSIYPLPRRLWDDLVLTGPVPAAVQALIKKQIEEDARERAAQEYLFDLWVLNSWSDGGLTPSDELKQLLAKAVEYKLVVRVIRGEGEHKDIETFQTIILPGSVVE